MTSSSPLPSFLQADPAQAAQILALDWEVHPLGPPAQWPQVVKATLATWLDSPQAMFIAWGPGLHFFFNAAYAPFLAERAGSAMGRPFHELWSDIWADIEPIVIQALAGKGSRFEDMPLSMVRNGRRETSWWTFTYMPLRDEAGSIVGMMCTANEVTGKVQAERQATLERERQRLLLQQMPGFVAVLSGPAHVFDYVNDAYRQISGPRSFIGRSVREVFPDLAGQGFYELLDQVYASHEPFVARSMPLRLDAGERFIDFLYHPIKDAEEQVIGIFVGGYDVTDRVAAEGELRALNDTLEQRVQEGTSKLMTAQTALRQAQKLEAVGQLTGGVAHDFNNLLTVIGSSVALLRRKNLPDDRRARYMDAISETVRRAAKLTGQLLAFARRQPLMPTVFDVGQQIGTVAELIRPLVGARVPVDLELCAPACYAEADVSQFETAVVNLAVNARDAMNGEGRLGIRVREVQGLPSLRGQEARSGDFVAVDVIDTGSGIEPDKLEAIFEPFYTTKEVGKGTGLGLSQVFGFAQQSGGDIEVHSVVGRGTTFTLYVPRAIDLPAPATPLDTDERGGPSTLPGPNGVCVLVVEDNESVGQFSTAILQDLGYATEWAVNASQALDVLEAGTPHVDIVFSDVIMPGMNGVELGRVLQQRYPGLPILLTSGYSEVLAEESRHGFRLIQKPYTPELLAEAIEQALARREPLPTV
jgi:signal transduction histidine kinase/CheY-like chemotaxis protein